MMKQTANLRFIKRQVDKDVHRILQQQWIDDDPPDEGAIRYAWHDVPTAEEQDAPPPQVDSGREDVTLPLEFIRNCGCPSDYFGTVGECIDRGTCGCSVGLALRSGGRA